MSQLLSPLLRQNRAAATFLATATPLLAIGYYAYTSYRYYMSIGPGGIPHNALGWLMQGTIRFLGLTRSDIRSPAPWTEDGDIMNEKSPFYDGEGLLEENMTSYFSDSDSGSGSIPVPRSRPLPRTTTTVAPHRQVDQMDSHGCCTPVWGEGKEVPNKEIQGRMDRFIKSLPTTTREGKGKGKGTKLEIKPSNLEHPDYPALYVVPGLGSSSSKMLPAQLANTTKGEIVHVHPSDGGSTHVVLSPLDAAIVVATGWGERHRMSGRWRLPWGYVLLFAPRDEAELEVWESIVRAAVGFGVALCEGKGEGKA